MKKSHRAVASSARARVELAAIAYALALGACTVGPDYERPALGEPASFRGPDDQQVGMDAAEVSAELGDLAWFELFEDPVLQDLLRTALRENFDLRIAVERILAAREAVTIAGADAYPQLSAGATGDASTACSSGASSERSCCAA